MGKVRFPTALIPSIAKVLQPEWIEEREMLGKLEEISRRDPPTPLTMTPVEPPMLPRNPSNFPSRGASGSAVIARRLTLPEPPGSEQIAVSQNLISALRSRLGNDEKSSWQFNLGVGLSDVFQLYRNPYERANAASKIKQFTETAPPDVSPEVAAALKNLAAIFETARRTMETDNEIRKSLIIILGGK